MPIRNKPVTGYRMAPSHFTLQWTWHSTHEWWTAIGTQYHSSTVLMWTVLWRTAIQQAIRISSRSQCYRIHNSYSTQTQVTGWLRWWPTESASVPIASYSISRFLCWFHMHHTQPYITDTGNNFTMHSKKMKYDWIIGLHEMTGSP